MADGPEAELLRELRELQQSYASRLSERLAALGHDLRRARDSEARVAEARVRAHTLKGTAGTYGYEGVADRLQRVEDALAALAEGDADAERLWREIDAAIGAARESVAQGPTLVS